MEGWTRRRWYGVVAAACLGAALVTTWPLLLHFASAVPLGTESAATIPVFDVWTLWWSADRLLHGYSGLWNAPIFHPTVGAFAFSEPLLLPGVLAAPFFLMGAPPAFVHNVVLLAILAGNGILACRLGRALGAGRLPALLAGVLMVSLPIFAKMVGELPILAVGGTLLALDGLIRFGHKGRTRDAIVAGLGVVVQALSGQQLALFALLFVAAAGIVALAERRFVRAAVVRLGAVGMGTALLLWGSAYMPLAVHREMGFSRAADLVQSLSARPIDFLTRPAGAIFPPREDPGVFTGGLFPGLLLLALAGVGAWGRWLEGPLESRSGARVEAQSEARPAARKAKQANGRARPRSEPPSADHRWQRWRWYAMGACVAAFLLSLGLNLSLLGWHPFATLRALPGFAEVRSVFRCAVFVQVALVMLAALGLSGLAHKLRGSPRAPMVVIAMGLLAALENLSLPARLLPLPRSAQTGWTAFLTAQPSGTVVAHVPFAAGGGVEDLAPDAWRMFAQLAHHQPLVNGYSSNFPAVYREFMFAMGANFPHHALACALRRVFGADLLVADQDWLSTHRDGFAELSTMLAPAYADSAVAIFRLQPSEEECPPMRIDLGPRP